MAKPPGRCIFCGRSGLSKEHLFADWLRELFPRSADDTHSIGEADDGPWRITQQQGHSGSKKIRTVCRTCNSGWVSRVDEAAKAVAPSLIQGEPAAVTPAAQRSPALWFAKIAAVADSRKRARSVVTPAHRQHIMHRHVPPDEWEIWLASYEGVDWRDLGLFQNGGRLDFTPVQGPGKEFAGYAETTFMGMGKMAVLVVADSLPLVDFSVGTFSQIARRIWPVQAAFSWPLPHTINDIEANAAAVILRSMVAHFRQEGP